MRYKGKVENGLVRMVDAHLPDGANVTVTLDQPIERPRKLADLMSQDFFDEGYSGELNDLLDRVMQEREESLRMEIEQAKRRDRL